MNIPYCYKINHNNFWLSTERMIYWEEEKALIVADLHFGKTGHFRKAGIAIPQSVYKEDLQRLISQLQYFQPAQLIVVGDMFHSVANKELELFKKWRCDFSHIYIQLVKGNHDILHEKWYKETGVVLNHKELIIKHFSFNHDVEIIQQNILASNYTFSGHIHPGIRISGMGKQSLHFPCFYFTPTFCVLPAFSKFTGLAIIKPKQEDTVFAIVNQSIVQM